MTTIQDKVTYFDGSVATGKIIVTWPPFNYGGIAIAAGQQEYPIAPDGSVVIDCYPCVGAQPPGTYYTATYELDKGAVYDEYWLVPATPTTTIGTIRVSVPETPSIMINAQQLISSGAQSGMFLGWNGSNWVPMYPSSFNCAVRSFFGRTGDVMPQTGDYTVDQVTGAVPDTRRIIAGSGLAGGGPLTGDVTLSLVGSGFVPSTTQIIAGPGLSGGGPLTGNVTLSVTAGMFAAQTTRIIAGTGLTGGGPLSADVTLSLAAGAAVPPTTQVIAGTGLTGGGPLSSNVTLSVVADTTVQRLRVSTNGTLVAARQEINFLVGNSIQLTATDDVTNNRVNVTVGFTGLSMFTNGTFAGLSSDLDLEAGANVTITGTLNGSVMKYIIASTGSGGGMTDPTTSVGDLIVRGPITTNRLGVGTDGETLIADSTQTLGMRWGAAGTGGAQSPWTSNIDAAGFALNHVRNIGINQASVAAVPLEMTSFAGSGDATIVINPAGSDALIGMALRGFGMEGGLVLAGSAYGVASWRSVTSLYSQVDLVVSTAAFPGDNSALERLRVLASNGNIGIAQSVPAYKLDVTGDVNVSAGHVYRVNGVPIATGQTPWTSNIDAAGFNLNNAGAIGIGTAAGSRTLTIQSAAASSFDISAINSNPVASLGMYLQNDSNDQVQFGLGGSNVGAANLRRVAFLYTTRDLSFGTGAALAERMRITAAGSVGIGTGSPATLFTIHGGADQNCGVSAGIYASGVAIASFNDAYTANAALELRGFPVVIGTQGSANPLPAGIFSGVYAMPEALIIQSDGATGSTNSKGPLVLVNPDPTVGNTASILFATQGTDGSIHGNAQIAAVFMAARTTGYCPTDLAFNTQNTNAGPAERMRITGAGLVGIGRTPTTYPLEVAGDVNLTAGSVYRINGVPLATGGGAQTPWTSNINGGGFALSNVSLITLNPSATNSSLRLGSMEFQGYALNNVIIADNVFYSAGWNYRSTGTGAIIQLTNTGINFGVFLTQPAGTVQALTPVQMILSNAGLVGINCLTPLAPLHVASATSGSVIFVDGYSGSPAVGTNPAFSFRAARGTAASPSAVAAGDILGQFNFRGYGATAFAGSKRAGIVAYAAENWTDSAQGAYFIFETASAGTTAVAERMRITAAGLVGIGVNPAWNLDVAGNINYTNGLFGRGLEAISVYDSYLRINQTSAFANGIYFGSSPLMLYTGGLYVGSQGSVAGAVAITASGGDPTNRITINGNANANCWFNTKGNFGIGTASPTGNLTVIPAANPGTIAACTQIQCGEASDNPGYRISMGFGTVASGSWAGVIQAIAGGSCPLQLQPNGGSVGINLGTVAPGYTLDVGGAIRASSNVTAGVKGSVFGWAQGGLTGLNASDANILLYNNSSVNWAGMGCDITGNVWIRTGTTSVVDAHFVISTTGNVGIAYGIPASYWLQLGVDSAAKPGTNTWTVTSDERVKRNIQPYTEGLETLLKLRPISYEYNGEAQTPEGYKGVGLLAQEVEAILPHFISRKPGRIAGQETEVLGMNTGDVQWMILNALRQIDERLRKANL